MDIRVADGVSKGDIGVCLKCERLSYNNRRMKCIIIKESK